MEMEMEIVPSERQYTPLAEFQPRDLEFRCAAV